MTELDPALENRWRALAEKALNGASFDRLRSRLAGGLSLEPLYTPANAPAGLRLRAPRAGWDIRQQLAQGDAGAANAIALEELEGGATSLEIAVAAPQGGPGVRLAGPSDLETLTAGWMLDLAPLALEADWPEPSAWLFAFAKGQGLLNAAFVFNRDPLGAALRQGAAPEPLADAIAFAERVGADFPNAAALRLDARPVHEAGGSEAHEIGAALAAFIAYARAGLAPGDLARLASVAVAIGPDGFLEIAKLRALRLAFARLLEACGAPPAPLRIHATTGRRMFTRRDPWVNQLRITAAGFAAAAGGADAVTLLPLTEALGQSTPFSRRLARNAQTILIEESHAGHVADPAAGAFAFEAASEQLARAGWEVFQAIEREGGLLAALQSGWLARETGAVRAEREKNVRRRKDAITGVSEFPLLGERTTDAEPWPRAASWPGDRALVPVRLAEPFERLRDAAEMAGAPPVFLATLGQLTEFSPRAQFAANLFAAGGLPSLGAEDTHSDDAALTAAFQASGARAACLCGSDAAYAERAESAARALKAAGCTVLAYAGRPGEQEGPLRAAGVDLFVFAGGDAVEALEHIHRALGVKP